VDARGRRRFKKGAKKGLRAGKTGSCTANKYDGHGNDQGGSLRTDAVKKGRGGKDSGGFVGEADRGMV